MGIRAAYPPGDMLSNLINSINSLTNPSGSTLTANAWNVITATSACNAKLPAPSAGKVCGVRLVNGSTNLFTLNPNASEKIQPGANTSRILWAGESAILVSDGTDWYKVAGLTRPMIGNICLSTTQGGITNTTYTKINLDTSLTDNTGLMVDTTNKRINIKRGGTYDISPFARASGIGANASRYISAVFQNGGGSPFFSGEGSLLSGSSGGPQVVAPYVLATGDFLELNAWQNSGSTQSVFGDGSGASAQLYAKEIPNW